MLSRFRRWFANKRIQRIAHKRAWQPVISPESDGLSLFQHMAAEALVKAIPGIKLIRAGQTQTYLTAPIPGQKGEVYIYYDQAEVIGGPMLFPGEHYDYDCPNDLVREFVAMAAREGAV